MSEFGEHEQTIFKMRAGIMLTDKSVANICRYHQLHLGEYFEKKQSAVTSSKTQEKEGSGFSYCDSWMEVLQPLQWSYKGNGRKKYRRKWDWWWGCWLWQWVRAWLNESLIMFDSPPLKSHGLQRTQIRIAQEKLERS